MRPRARPVTPGIGRAPHVAPRWSPPVHGVEHLVCVQAWFASVAATSSPGPHLSACGLDQNPVRNFFPIQIPQFSRKPPAVRGFLNPQPLALNVFGITPCHSI